MLPSSKRFGSAAEQSFLVADHDDREDGLVPEEARVRSVAIAGLVVREEPDPTAARCEGLQDGLELLLEAATARPRGRHAAEILGVAIHRVAGGAELEHGGVGRCASCQPRIPRRPEHAVLPSGRVRAGRDGVPPGAHVRDDHGGVQTVDGREVRHAVALQVAGGQDLDDVPDLRDQARLLLDHGVRVVDQEEQVHRGRRRFAAPAAGADLTHAAFRPAAAAVEPIRVGVGAAPAAGGRGADAAPVHARLAGAALGVAARVHALAGDAGLAPRAARVRRAARRHAGAADAGEPGVAVVTRSAGQTYAASGEAALAAHAVHVRLALRDGHAGAGVAALSPGAVPVLRAARGDRDALPFVAAFAAATVAVALAASRDGHAAAGRVAALAAGALVVGRALGDAATVHAGADGAVAIGDALDADAPAPIADQTGRRTGIGAVAGLAALAIPADLSAATVAAALTGRSGHPAVVVHVGAATGREQQREESQNTHGSQDTDPGVAFARPAELALTPGYTTGARPRIVGVGDRCWMRWG